VQGNMRKQQPAAAVVASMRHSKGSDRSCSRSSSPSRTKCTSYAALGLMACEGAL
jgi:hypothetical protein